MNSGTPTRIVILGGGFGGIYAAMELERLFRAYPTVEITLVNQDNFMVFTPMLHEIAASDLDATHIVNPIHKLLRKARFFCGSVDFINLKSRSVVVSHGNARHSHELSYDHLVLALGSVTHFYGLPGLAENAITMKSLGDALHLRNQMIALLEEADFDCCKEMRSSLLTFVVAGAGFAGVETVAAINDFTREVVKNYPNLRDDDVRIVLVSSGKVILPELHESLGHYAGELLKKRGVEFHYGVRVQSYSDGEVSLSNGEHIKACTLVWTAGTTTHPLLESLSCTKEKGRVLVDDTLAVLNCPGAWALGDCAAIPDGYGGFHPPTAQHAIRQARTVARNIAAAIHGKQAKPFRFRTLGQLASLGHQRGVAQIFGFRFSGFAAWWLWRTIYLLKLPRFERRCRVAFDWTLDLMLGKDTVQLPVSSESFRAADAVPAMDTEGHASSSGRW